MGNSFAATEKRSKDSWKRNCPIFSTVWLTHTAANKAPVRDKWYQFIALIYTSALEGAVLWRG